MLCRERILQRYDERALSAVARLRVRYACRVMTRSVVVMSGSTRAASTNTAFARTAAAHPPAGSTVTAWTALAELPHFDPDLDRDPLPAAVAALRDLLAAADAVVLCTPEYAGALPGAFKNALDWTMGSTVFSDKPVAWIKVAADARRGEGAHAELATVLGYVQARVLPQACTHYPSTATPSTPTD